jgi:ribonuclease G
LKNVFIERESNLLRIAVKKNDVLEECYFEEEAKGPIPDEIYVGMIKSLVPAIKCAFVDIGFSKNAYLYLDTKFKNTKLKKGSVLLVQVLKEASGSKGAKVTSAISIPGRYCVIQTLNNDINFSKKITNEAFKSEILRVIDKPADSGVMIRTNAENVSVDVVSEEIKRLYELYKKLLKDSTYNIVKGRVFNDGGILGKVLRDRIDALTSKIIVNDIEDYNYIKAYLKNTLDVKPELVLHNETRTLLAFYGLEQEILNLRNNKVYLKCGGFLVIDKTEAMFVIDVNSGKNVENSTIDKTAFTTNKEAASVICRQIKLRNLSGIIVVDFIDMEDEIKKKKIIDILKEGFQEDKNKTVVYSFTQLNLVQIARRKSGRSISEYIEENCSECLGRGTYIKFSYITHLIRNEVLRLQSEREINEIFIKLSPYYRKSIEENVDGFLKNIDAQKKEVYIEYTNVEGYFKVDAVIFKSQRENMQQFKL